MRSSEADSWMDVMLAAYREIEETVINQDAAFIGLYSPLNVGLGVPNVKGDDMSPIYGWPFVEKAQIVPG